MPCGAMLIVLACVCPEGSHYALSQSASIAPHNRFLSALVNSGQCPDSIGGMALFKRYSEYHEAGRFKGAMTVAAFGRYLKGVQGISKDHARTGTVYRMDPEALRAHLVQARLFDDEASLA